MSVEAPWMDVAQRFIGLREIKGSQHEKKIIAFAHKIGHTEVNDDETAWCANFAGYCLEVANYKSTRSMAARSYERFGEQLSQPRYGCIVVLKRGKAWQGHVGFFLKRTKTKIWLLSGNSSDSVNEAPYNISDVIAYRWPVDRIKSLLQSKTATAAGGIAGTAAGDAGVTVEDTIDKARQAKDVADSVGFWDWLPMLVQQPRFWIAVVIILLAAAVIYWRWRDHGRGETT